MLSKVMAWSIKVRKFLQCKNRPSPFVVRVGKELLYPVVGIFEEKYYCNK
ncbi:hypothetical protein VCHA37P200_10443 [Vibrio chagasii]|nr:hypothetical protein VCHA34O109_170069 [Vibrio chagasii]CAH6930176.1 hypothetical protein VCHA29O37_30037 [Vibrio chagasii]CAH6962817.1 hypothetical protein VCHA49P382_110052 [Vibrio chagasii]CAH6999624.1 hypothetical protein VCHA36O163_50318 [Vibrio chagasii]CAH7011795.1 hypothetical protein VCHA31O71_50320 [Vibrio chagasii]